MDALREAMTAVALEVIDNPLGFDPTEDMLVPTSQDEAERIAAAVLPLVWVARQHEKAWSLPPDAGSPKWRMECSCRLRAEGGTIKQAEQAWEKHLASALATA